MTKKLLWAFLLSVTFMVFLINIVDWSHFSSIVDRVIVKNLFIAFGALLCSNIVRSFRFYTLDHIGKKLTPWLIINKIYNFMTATLPGGLGEAATAYILKRYSSFNMFSAIRILLLSRVMDLAGLSALLIITLMLIKTEVYYRHIMTLSSSILLLISIVAIIPATEQFVLRLIKKLSGQNRTMQKIREKLDMLAEISEKYQGSNTFSITIIQSFLLISITAVSLHYIMLSFESSFTLMQSFYCYSVYAILQIIPIQGIAGIGTQPARWVIALNAAGYKGEDVVALSFVLHGTFYIFIAIMGMSAFMIWFVSRKTY